MPKGYIDENGDLHREGTMRLATAADEILPLKDPRVLQNAAYLPVIIFSRVITRLGTLKVITTKVIEDLFADDFAYLQDFYNNVNAYHNPNKELITCSKCGYSFPLTVHDQAPSHAAKPENHKMSGNLKKA